MARALPLPDGTSVTIREGETPEQTWARAQQMYPEAFGFGKKEEGVKRDTTGFKAAAAAGIESIKGEAALTAGKLGLKDMGEAEKYHQEQEKKARARFTPTEDGWTESPWQKFKETLGGSVPYMGAPVAAGLSALALPVAAPVAAGVGLGLAGLASTGQFTGLNLSRQMDTGKTLAQTDLGAAFGAAIPQALLDTAAMALMPGIGKLFGSVGSKITTAQARTIADQTLGRVVADYTAKTGAAMGREGFTETAQQLLERLQAGLDITDPEARKEYIDSFIGGAALAGAGAPIGRAFERSAAKNQATAADKADKSAARATELIAQEQADKALEAQKSTPEYALKIANEYAAAEQQKATLLAQIRKGGKGNPLSEEDKAFNKTINEQLSKLAPTLKALGTEKNRVTQSGLLAQAQEQQRVAGMSPEDYALEQMQQQVATKQARPRTPGAAQPATIINEFGEEVPNPNFQPAASAAPAPIPDPVAQYAAQQMQLVKERVQLPAGMDYIEYLMVDPYMANMVVANRVELPGLTPAESNLIRRDLGKRLKAEGKEEMVQREADLKGQNVKPTKDINPLAQFLADQDMLDAARQEGFTEAEIKQLEKLAAMPRSVVEQGELFGSQQRVNQLAGASPQRVAADRADKINALQRQLDIAYVQRNIKQGGQYRETISKLVEQLRDLQSSIPIQGQSEFGQASESIQGQLGQLPQDLEAQRLAAEARNEVLGRVAQKDDSARMEVLESLVDGIKAVRGDLRPETITQIEKEAKPILDMLSRYGNNALDGAVGMLDGISQKWRSGTETTDEAVTRTTTPTSVSTDMLRDQMERAFIEEQGGRTTESTGLRQRYDSETAGLLKRIAKNFDAVAADPERREMVSEWLHRATQTGAPAPEMTSDVRGALDTLEQGTLVDSGQQELPQRFMPKQVAGQTTTEVVDGKAVQVGGSGLTTPVQKVIEFKSAAEFQKFLSSDAVREMRQAAGLSKDSAVRLHKRMEVFRTRYTNILTTAQARVDALNKRGEEIKNMRGEETRVAQELMRDAQLQLDKIYARLDEELQVLQIAYLQTRQQFYFTATTVEDIGQKIADNVAEFENTDSAYVAAVQKLAMLKADVARATRSIQGQLEKQTTKEGKEATNIQSLLATREKIIQAINDVRKITNRDNPSMLAFLQADMQLQLEMQEEERVLEQDAKALLNAGLALGEAAAAQKRSRKNKVEIEKAQADIAASIGILKKDLPEIQRDATVQMIALNKEIDAAESEVRKIQSKLAPKEAPKSTFERLLASMRFEPISQTERDALAARDAAERETFQDMVARLAAIPGTRIDFEKRRAMLELVGSNTENVDKLEQNIRDAERGIEEMQITAAIAEDAIADTAAGHTPEQVAQLQTRMDVANKRAQVLQESVGNYEAQRMTMQKAYDRAVIATSSDPEVFARITAALDARVIKLAKNIAENEERLKAKENKKGEVISEKTRAQTLKRVGKYKNELAKTRARMSDRLGITRTDAVTGLPDAGKRKKQMSVTDSEKIDAAVERKDQYALLTAEIARLEKLKEKAVAKGQPKAPALIQVRINKLEDERAEFAPRPKGDVTQVARIQSAAPGKFRAGTDLTKAAVGAVRQPIVEGRTIKQPTVAAATKDANAFSKRLKDARSQTEIDADFAAQTADTQIEIYKAAQDNVRRFTAKVEQNSMAVLELEDIHADATTIPKLEAARLLKLRTDLVYAQRALDGAQIQLVSLNTAQDKIEGATVTELEGTTMRERSRIQQVFDDEEGSGANYSRGVEIDSPDLTAAQVKHLENNDLTAALDSLVHARDTDKIYRAVAERLKKLLDVTSVLIEDKLVDKNGKEVLGAATSKQLWFNRDGGLTQEVLLHEGTHAATERIINMPEHLLTPMQRIAKKELQMLRAAVKNDPRITSENAKGSLSEFVAEVMSNKKLQEQLQNKKWKLQDAWKGFKSIILRMLGMDNKEVETMLGAALQSVDALFVPSSKVIKGTPRKETVVNRTLAKKDIAALHSGSNSMQQFAAGFQQFIKQKDRTAEDANQIGREYLSDMLRKPEDYIAEAAPNRLDYKSDTIMADGTVFDANNLLHLVEATPTTFLALQAQKDPDLRDSEAGDINYRRVSDLRSLVSLLTQNDSYTSVEQALVAKAAAKWAVQATPSGSLELASIEPTNRHGVSIVSTEAADAVIEELRAGKPLKEAFLKGMQKIADRNVKQNTSKQGWVKFDQSQDESAAVSLNAASAGTSWCTGSSVVHARGQINNGDFYIFYDQGKPEVAIRMDGKTKIGEIRGNTSAQFLNDKQQRIADTFLRQAPFSGTEYFMEETARKPMLMRIIKGEAQAGDSAVLRVVLQPFKTDVRSMQPLFEFHVMDGYAARYRPKPQPLALFAIRDKLKAAAIIDAQKGYFYAENLSFGYAGNSKYTIGKNVLRVSPEDVIAARDISVHIDGTTLMPRLKTVDNISLFNNLSMPMLESVNSVTVFSKKGALTMSLGPDTIVGDVSGFGRDAEVTINGGHFIKQLETVSTTGTLVAHINDAQYIAPPSMNRRWALRRVESAIEEMVDKNMSAARLEVLDVPFGPEHDAVLVKTMARFEKVIGSKAVGKLIDKIDPLLGRKFGVNRLSLLDTALSVIDSESGGEDAVSNIAQKLSEFPIQEIFDIAKKLNAAGWVGEHGTMPEKMPAYSAPKRVASAPPVKMAEYTQTAEEPRFARKSDSAMLSLADKILAQPKTFREKAADVNALALEMSAVDMRAALEQVFKRGAASMGDNNFYTQAMSLVRKADDKIGQANSVLQFGPLELYRDEKGLMGVHPSGKDSAKDIYEAVAKIPASSALERMQMASVYLIAIRAANKGLSKLDMGNLKVTQADLDAVMAEAKADPELFKALEEVRRRNNAYNKGMIEFNVVAGSITRKLADELMADGDFVPFYRVRGDGMAELVFSGNSVVSIGDIRTQPYLKQLVGGEQKIMLLSESLPRNTMLLVDKALTNLAQRNVAFGLQTLGKGKGAIDPKTGKPKDLMSIKKGMGSADGRTLRFNMAPDPKDPNDTGARYQVVDTEGTAIEGIPAEMVIKSLEGAHLALPGFLKLAGSAADLLRTAVTRTPLYIARQLYKEPMAATFTGGLNYSPFRAVLEAGKEYGKSMMGRSETYAKMLEKGLVQSHIFSGSPEDLHKMGLQLASGIDGQSTINKLFAGLDRAAMIADAASRTLVYTNARKSGFSEVEAEHMAREYLNFSKRGLSPTVQYAARMIPFLNAQIQSLNVLYKALRGNMPFEEQLKIKRKFYNNAMLLFATGVVYAFAMEDDEYYKNARPRDKYTNFFLHLPGVEEPIKIATPFEAGWFFSLAVAAVDGMKAETRTSEQFDALRDLFLNAIPGYSSMGMPQLIKPAFEVWTNKNFFSGAPIESLRMKNMDISDRYNVATTEMAKAMSAAVPILSPVQIEHIVRGYFGIIPLAAAAMINGAVPTAERGERPSTRASELPLIGAAFQRKMGGAQADEIFELADKAFQARGTLNSRLKEGRREEALSFRDAHRVELASATDAGQYRQLIGRLNSDIRRTQNRTDLTGDEKRARLDRIEDVKTKMASDFLTRYRAREARLGG